MSVIERIDLRSSGVSLNFVNDIDLMDETLREGAERATVAVSVNDKYGLGRSIASAGIRSIVVGMFPDVPHNVQLLKELVAGQLRGEISAETRFLVISHLGERMRQTQQLLGQLGIPLNSVWIIAIYSVSDQHIQYLFPKIATEGNDEFVPLAQWEHITPQARREYNLAWLDAALPSVTSYDGGGILLGCLDAFRADAGHLSNVIQVADRHLISQIRLVDTAGTCFPHQLNSYVGALIAAYPHMSFYGHFHNDFGMATANAIMGLALGMKGVDVSIGGFGNRAGHPPAAEVSLALKELYGIELSGFAYERLYELSRLVEQVYGIMECPTQPVTGVITHSILSGIRTELKNLAPDIFDIINPESIGSALFRSYGVRSGKDGLLRFMKEHAELFENYGITINQNLADYLYDLINESWEENSASLISSLRERMSEYYNSLHQSFFDEKQLLAYVFKYFQGDERYARATVNKY